MCASFVGTLGSVGGDDVRTLNDGYGVGGSAIAHRINLIDLARVGAVGGRSRLLPEIGDVEEGRLVIRRPFSLRVRAINLLCQGCIASVCRELRVGDTDGPRHGSEIRLQIVADLANRRANDSGAA